MKTMWLTRTGCDDFRSLEVVFGQVVRFQHSDSRVGQISREPLEFLPTAA